MCVCGITFLINYFVILKCSTKHKYISYHVLTTGEEYNTFLIHDQLLFSITTYLILYTLWNPSYSIIIIVKYNFGVSSVESPFPIHFISFIPIISIMRWFNAIFKFPIYLKFLNILHSTLLFSFLIAHHQGSVIATYYCCPLFSYFNRLLQ